MADIEAGPRVPAALRSRRFAVLPLRGPGAAFTEAQGREPGPATSPRELSDLISSIAEVGVIQPILVEQLPAETDGEPPALRVVVGERRLRACRWGAAHLSDNPHFAGIPASICPGPLTEEDRRVWQLIENLAREPLRPGEQAAALLYQRCAQLTANLLRAGRSVPDEVVLLDDPVRRYEQLEAIRAGDPQAAVPWDAVLGRLGLQLTARRANELVRAFKILPRELSEDMDEQGVRVATRIRFAALRADRQAAADEIWLALKAAGRTDLLSAAAGAAAADPSLDANQAVQSAAEQREAAIRTRAQALTKTVPVPPAGPPGGEPAGDGELDAAHHAEPGEEEDGAHEPPTETTQPVTLPAGVAAAALRAIRDLLGHLRAGAVPGRYDAGSLRLLLGDALNLLPAEEHGA